ncbi:MAG: hypothetical protein Q9219_003411 [cf. Caloplaca sp. 3 TL-2023]
MASKRVLPMLVARPLRSSSTRHFSRLVTGNAPAAITRPAPRIILNPPFLHDQQPRNIRLNSSTTATASSFALPDPTFEQLKSYSQTPTPSRLLIDLREPTEQTISGKIPNSVTMPLNSNPDAVYMAPDDFYDAFGFEKPGSAGQVEEAKEDGKSGEEVDEVVFYCRVGVRSKVAMQMALGDGGWEGVKVSHYEPGMIGWEQKGGPIER